MSPSDRPTSFRYAGFDVDDGAGELVCRYEAGSRRFEERVRFGAGHAWTPAALEAARLVHLLAGVSYYKAFAPPVLDLGDEVLRPGEAAFLRRFYVDGLGEFAYRNGLRLDGLRVEAEVAPRPPQPVAAPGAGPLVPFGGGLDSIVTVELLRERHPGMALFVMHRAGSRFEAIEAAAAATGLPVARAERELDDQVLRSAELGWLNGHVPVTGVLSAVAVLRAVLDGRGTVVMSNERSASSGNVAVDGAVVNHQWSKSLAFETAWRDVLAEALPGLEYFSLLRPLSELWIARRFASLGRYHRVFRSCNRAFHLDAARRLDTWCGRCDKCCFIDLVLAPFLPAEELDAVFGGAEPLGDPALRPRFEALLDLSGDLKPWECVGDVEECRAALVLAADRSDRGATPLLHDLVEALGPRAEAARRAAPGLLAPAGPHHVPDGYAPDALLG